MLGSIRPVMVLQTPPAKNGTLQSDVTFPTNKIGATDL